MLRDAVDNQDHDQNGRSKTSVQHGPATTSPTKLKHSPRRSSSWAPTFYSSTTVPAAPTPGQTEPLSSLISSLTSISDAKQSTTLAQQPRTNSNKKAVATDLARFSADPRFQQSFRDDKQPWSVADDELDFCPPPVAGYNTINADSIAPRPKTADAKKSSRRFKDKQSQPFLKPAKSQVLLSTSQSSRNLQSPDSIPSIPRTSYGDESIASLPASTNSKVSKKSAFKMFFSQGLGNERNYARPILPPQTAYDTAASSPEKDKDRDLRFSAFVTLGRVSADIQRKDSDTHTFHSLSPSNHTDLNDNLIPSRRSSLRSAPRRSSRSSRDLKSLNIDQDLIEENHETVQRIRELQQAREKRHSEWRKEARKSEKTSKRVSRPGQNPSPVRSTPSLASSWHAPVIETLESEEPPQMSATLAGPDLASMPAFVEGLGTDPLTPIEKPSPFDTNLRRNLSITASSTQSISSAKRHRKRLSETMKRASSVRQPAPDDAKRVLDDVDAHLASPRFTQKIRHPRTGRTIAFSEVGDPNGFVVICCVGMGLTRYVTTFYDEIAKTQKLRIITPDRPGVAETDAMPAERSTPLAWVDDVAAICTSLGIEKFSLLAHSAGAIYALATALKMPQYVRGRIHLLGPWIPPSQLQASGNRGSTKAADLPTSHKILSFLPASFMKAANSRLLSATSASIEPRNRKGKSNQFDDLGLHPGLFNGEASVSAADMSQSSMLPTPESSPKLDPPSRINSYELERMRLGSPPLSPTPSAVPRASTLSPTPSGTRTPSGTSTPYYLRALTPMAREKLYNTTLTQRTWSLATLNANPAVDLVICLERRRPIGFKYTDITRAIVLHHGANDTRVPLDNARWLSSVMKRCELRVLEGEGHGLMASASVMSNVLTEMGKEWEEWSHVAKAREQAKKEEEAKEQQAIKERERGRRRGYPRW